MSSSSTNYITKKLLLFVSACGISCLIPLKVLAARLPSLDGPTEIAASAQQSSSHSAGGNKYYVNCEAPDVNGDGHSPEAAWSSLNAVNAHTFSSGDVIYLKRGTECHGMLWPKGSGNVSSIIRLSAYGNGERPKVVAGKGDEEAFKLFDQEYWDVDSIEFSGGTTFGVFVSGQTGILHHIHLRNLLVHDVHGGEVKHKESGLVVISPGKVEQHFDDVLVEGVAAYDTEQWAGILVGGGNFGEVAEKDWSTHVIVRNSAVHDVYGDGIVLFRIKDGLIDTSAAWRTGMQPTQSIGTPNAIWTWMCTDCIVSRNEAFLTDSPGVDGGAYDIDYGNTRNSVVANYGHDTQGYCIAVFAAGYVTHESAVEGNLCINNGKSPRMARYQGAIFLWTWNDGVVENLRVEKNTIYWDPPGNFPALLNRADIRGSQRIFRENVIYSGSSQLIESNRNLTFDSNRYITCGGSETTWSFDNRTYHAFDEYRAGAGQEQGSSWLPDLSASSCLGRKQSLTEDRTNDTKRSSLGWTLVSELPVSIDSSGLLDSALYGQLVVLKNLNMQFRASGLHTKIQLILPHPTSCECVEEVLHDLRMSGIDASQSTGSSSLTNPTTRLVAPNGSTAGEWQGFIGPVPIGMAVRRVLGEPLYSQMKSEMK